MKINVKVLAHLKSLGLHPLPEKLLELVAEDFDREEKKLIEKTVTVRRVCQLVQIGFQPPANPIGSTTAATATS